MYDFFPPPDLLNFKYNDFKIRFLESWISLWHHVYVILNLYIYVCFTFLFRCLLYWKITYFIGGFILIYTRNDWLNFKYNFFTSSAIYGHPVHFRSLRNAKIPAEAFSLQSIRGLHYREGGTVFFISTTNWKLGSGRNFRKGRFWNSNKRHRLTGGNISTSVETIRFSRLYASF